MQQQEAIRGRKKWQFAEKHYRELAKWSERVALLLFGSVVLQNVVGVFSFTKPVVIFGLVLTGAMYYMALHFLNQS